MKNKKAIEMSFNWLFSIIAGIVILSLAIYGATKVIDTGTQIVSTESAAKLTAFLDPAQSGIAYGQVSPPIEFNKEVRLEFSCNLDDNPPFGKQSLRFAEESFGKISEFSYPIDIVNNYVFSENVLEGKKIYVYSKSFNLPFKVADMILLSTEQYCFVNAPRFVENDLENLKNVNFTNDIDDCGDIKSVCFQGTGSGSTSECHTIVKDGSNKNLFTVGSVEKDGGSVYYYDNLIYPAIMSSEENYECNLKRLMNKFIVVSNLYLDKISILEKNGCGSTVAGRLNEMISAANSFEDSLDLESRKLVSKAKEVERENPKTACKLYDI